MSQAQAPGAAAWQFPLRRGNSPDPRQGACLLDAVSWVEYGRLGDHPACVCPVLAEYGRGLNDLLPPFERQKLRIFVPLLAGTVDPQRGSAARGSAALKLDLTPLERRRVDLLRQASFAIARACGWRPPTKPELWVQPVPIVALEWAVRSGRYTSASWTIYDPAIAAFAAAIALGGVVAAPVDAARMEAANLRFALARAA